MYVYGVLEEVVVVWKISMYPFAVAMSCSRGFFLVPR